MIPEVTRLRERAVRCREIAKEYHPSVGAPLYETAAELEREAARIEREGLERRQGALFPRPSTSHLNLG
jgi:hypothetical protein